MEQNLRLSSDVSNQILLPWNWGDCDDQDNDIHPLAPNYAMEKMRIVMKPLMKMPSIETTGTST